MVKNNIKLYKVYIIMILILGSLLIFVYRIKIMEFLYFSSNRDLRNYYFHIAQPNQNLKIFDAKHIRKNNIIHVISIKNDYKYIILLENEKKSIFKKFDNKIYLQDPLNGSSDWIMHYNLMANKAYSQLKDSIFDWQKFKNKIAEKYFFVIGMNNVRSNIEFLVIADSAMIDRFIYYKANDRFTLKSTEYYLDKSFAPRLP